MKKIFRRCSQQHVSDKTVRNLRVNERHESVLSNDRVRADYLIKR